MDTETQTNTPREKERARIVKNEKPSVNIGLHSFASTCTDERNQQNLLEISRARTWFKHRKDPDYPYNSFNEFY